MCLIDPVGVWTEGTDTRRRDGTHRFVEYFAGYEGLGLLLSFSKNKKSSAQATAPAEMADVRDVAGHFADQVKQLRDHHLQKFQESLATNDDGVVPALRPHPREQGRWRRIWRPACYKRQ